MSEVPEFVALVRGIIPKDGVNTDKPSRIKSKIRKTLINAGYNPETLRGIGLKLDDFAIVYGQEDNILTANFQKYDDLPKEAKSTKKRKASKAKVSPLITGIHPSIANYTNEQFVRATIEFLPEDWVKVTSDQKMIATDMVFLHKTQHTPETAANYLITLANEKLSVFQVNYNVIQIGGNHIIGIGPVT